MKGLKRPCFALLGLMALALQLVGALGLQHAHAGVGQAYSSHVVHSDAHPAALCDTAEDCRSTQGGHVPGGEETGCDICLALATARAIGLPAPLVLTAPARFQDVVFIECPRCAGRLTWPLGFQARGPPRAALTA